MTGEGPVRTVAVLGTGHMGSAMSRALAAAGFDLVLYNRTLERCEPLAAELGCRVAPTAAEAVAAADVAISMVADEGFWSLDAPIVRITTPHIPLPSASALEDAAIPSVDRIVETVRTTLEASR